MWRHALRWLSLVWVQCPAGGAQLALHEPAVDIAHILDEYAPLLERTEFHLFEGELHQLRVRLADREGRRVEQAAALQRAHDCYTHFGMTAQAARVARSRSASTSTC